MKGGYRKGAGRKRLPQELKKMSITIRLKQSTVAWLKLQGRSYAATFELLVKGAEE
jgi:hypothetical protein